MPTLTRAMLISLLAPSLALGQPPAAVALEHDGRPGVWFELAEAQRLNALDVSSGAQAARFRLIEQQLTLAVEVEIPALRRALELETQAAARWEASAGHQESRARAAEKRADAIWRSPALWLLFGLIVGAGGAALVFSSR